MISLGRDVCKETEGLSLSTFHRTTGDAPGCCIGAVYTKAPAVGRWLRKRGPAPPCVSSYFPQVKASCGAQSYRMEPQSAKSGGKEREREEERYKDGSRAEEGARKNQRGFV